jgi:4-hydroxythreonine-4-phosphate dehydrogenase
MVANQSEGPIALVVSRFHWDQQSRALGSDWGDIQWVSPTEFAAMESSHFSSGVYGIDIGSSDLDRAADQLSPKERGELAIRALQVIPKRSSSSLAVLTGPIDKSACAAAGFKYVGQTEFFQSHWDHPAVMVLAGSRLKVGLVTNHLPLSQVSKAVTKELIVQKSSLFMETLARDFGIEDPRIGVCGLNPHAGDQGLLGREDLEIVRPAVEELREQGLNVEGPIPADTIFYRAYHGAYDGVLAMYHDQGLAPLKLVHFDTAVNVSGGLPHMRISPDHGPAADIYLKKQMSHASWQQAYKVATSYLKRRR